MATKKGAKQTVAVPKDPSKVVVIGCKLPHGIVLHHPMDRNLSVTLNGRNKARIIGADYATTEVDVEFWEVWKAAHEGGFAPLDSGAIFEGRNVAEAEDKARELEGEKTGLEPLEPESNGVKPADKE